MKNYSNILLIKPGAVGDLLQLTPVIRALAQKYPGAGITLMLGSSASATMFQHNPHISETIVFDRKGAHRSLSDFLQLWNRIRAARYDLVVNFQRSNVKAWLLAAAAFPCRVLVYHKARGRSVHAVVNHLETLAPLGIAPELCDPSLELSYGSEEQSFADHLFPDFGNSGKILIALNPGASNRIKCWSPEQFAALANLLVSKLDAGIVLVGGGSERDLAEGILAGMDSKPFDLIGKTSLLQLGAVLARCDVLVSGDTGPLHMATAVKTPVAALFGAIDPFRTGPVGEGHRVIRHDELACVPCVAKSCENRIDLECMQRITPVEVFDTVVDMLKTMGRLA
ncbi:MAG: glycosyltransferase family 9 protein [Geobacteraceae bacterium]